MASSPIEIAPSYFGCVLRDHNQRIIRERNRDREREREREGTHQAAALRKNLAEFVRDHFQTCIPFSTSREDGPSDENSQPGRWGGGTGSINDRRNRSIRPIVTNNRQETASITDDNNRNVQPNNVSTNVDNTRQETTSTTDDRRNKNVRPIVTNKKSNGEETPSTESSPSTRRQSSRLMDRWATRQGGGEDVNVNERKRKNNEAELLALSNAQPVSARASSFLRECSPTASDSSSVDVPNLRASSLVQRWKEIEAEATVTSPSPSCKAVGLNLNPASPSTSRNNSVNSNTGESCVEDPDGRSSVEFSTAAASSSRMNSAISNIEDSSIGEPSMLSTEVCDSNDERCEDTFPDWESDRTSGRLSASHGNFSDTAESERAVRVADIIRRLTSASQPQSPVASMSDEIDREQAMMVESMPRDHSLSDHSVTAGNTPRVRGRQAFKDLLIQIERDRQRELTGLVERHAVSKFSHRGRIQSLLKLRFLQRGAGSSQGSQTSASRASDRGQQLQCRTAILRLRERFSPNVAQHGPSVLSREDDTGSRRPTPSDRMGTEQSDMLSREVDRQQPDVAPLEQNRHQEHNSVPSTSEQLVQEEGSERSDVTWEEPSSGVSHSNWRETMDTAESSQGWKGEVITAQEPQMETRQHVGGLTNNWERLAQNTSAEPMNTAGSSQVWKRKVIAAQEPQTEIRQHVGGLTNVCARVAQISWAEPVNNEASSSPSSSSSNSHGWEGEAITTEEPEPEPQQQGGGSADGYDGVSSPSSSSSNSHGWEGEAIATEEPELEPQQQGGGSADGYDGINHLVWQETTNTDGLEGDVMTTEEPHIETRQHVGASANTWDEEAEQPDNHQFMESPVGTWTREPSHPHSDWEGRRRAWYLDMLDNNTDNDEIRELFERRTVSSFLSSERRERMDRMVFSFIRRQQYETNEGEEEDHEHPIDEEHHYNEVSDETDHVESTSLPLPSLLRSRNQYHQRENEVRSRNQYHQQDNEVRSRNQYHQDNEVSDGYNQAAFTSFHLPQSSHSDNDDSQNSSPFPRHPSMEMELIYDLRGHMAQLHHEMSELRKSIQSCMGMQVQLQNSIKEEVTAAVCNSIRGGESKELFSRQNSMRRANCCICYEMQVDSLLYRCGHMCTCFKCAHELQWSSGRCPICRAPIVDVVRAYPDS